MTKEAIPKKTVCCPGPYILTHTSEALTPGHHHHVSRTRSSISKDGSFPLVITAAITTLRCKGVCAQSMDLTLLLYKTSEFSETCCSPFEIQTVKHSFNICYSTIPPII